MFRPISFWLTFHWGGMTPMRRLLFPGGSEQCSSIAWGQGSEETLPYPVGRAGKTHAHRHAHLHISHTRTHSVAPFAPSRGSRLCSSKFWMEQLLRVKEWQVHSRFQQAHRGEVGWQSSGITTWVEAVCPWLSELRVCLPLSFSPRAF